MVEPDGTSKAAAEALTPFLPLPTELRIQIVNYLDTRDIARLYCVSKHFQHLKTYVYRTIDLTCCKKSVSDHISYLLKCHETVRSYVWTLEIKPTRDNPANEKDILELIDNLSCLLILCLHTNILDDTNNLILKTNILNGLFNFFFTKLVTLQVPAHLLYNQQRPSPLAERLPSTLKYLKVDEVMGDERFPRLLMSYVKDKSSSATYLCVNVKLEWTDTAIEELKAVCEEKEVELDFHYMNDSAAFRRIYQNLRQTSIRD